MKIGFASDHRGYALKQQLMKELSKEYDVVDYGTYSEEPTDYPDYAFILGESVASKQVSFGVAICGSGIGISIACNKVKGIRCAKVDTVKDVIATRNDNDTNIVAFGESKTLEEALELVLTFITTPCSMEEKHVRRRNKIINYEEQA